MKEEDVPPMSKTLRLIPSRARSLLWKPSVGVRFWMLSSVRDLRMVVFPRG